MWRVGHRHERDDGPARNCREVLALHPLGGRGRLEIVFREGPGRVVPDGLLHAGGVGTRGAYLNLNEPGTVRALLDEAVAAHGWDSDDPVPVTIDGWTLFDAVSARRPEGGTESEEGAPGPPD
ncbi:hypothetical protein E6R60_16605 [Streptomyces sp. A0642]|nr:hypothetical protein E6R60_16605 [Streptomyces sp. A0642]